MSHAVTISDDAYHALETLAQRQGQTPETLIETWVTQNTPPDLERAPIPTRSTIALTSSSSAWA